MSLASGGRSLEVGKFEKELEDALLSTQAGSINVSYWMNNWPSIEECLELLSLNPLPLVSTALMPTDKGIECMLVTCWSHAGHVWISWLWKLVKCGRLQFGIGHLHVLSV